ncbi:MAG TPA: hypothetical protein VJU61_06685, partial [Polyangiaceae bacterium]|nr:hypothetical protein [Polyangiaceae bacterium]
GQGPLPFAGSDAAAPVDARCGTPPDAVACPAFLMSFDDIYRALLADLETQRPEDRPFLRYLGLVNRRNAGVCGAALDVDRWAMDKVLNSVSTEFEIALPEPIDTEQTLYRVDLRRYGWDRQVTVFGTTFNDGWEALAANNVYAREFEGGAADSVKVQTGTAFPYQAADTAFEYATVGDTYYALVGAPTVGDSVDDFVLNQLGVDTSDQLLRGISKAAGFRGSGVSRQPRVVHRYPFAADRVLWHAFDFAEDQNESIFDDPLGFADGGGFSIYSLPNLLHGYLAWDANGFVQEQSEYLFHDDDFIVAARTCMGCHSQGILPVRDQLRTYVEANPANYSPDEAAAIQATFVPVEEMDALVEADRQVYLGALGQLGFPTDCPDPVSQVVRRFSRPLTLRDALGELGVSQAAFEAVRPLLDPSVAGLLNVGLLERASFGGQYGKALCAVNPPSAADAGASVAVPTQVLCGPLLDGTLF